MDIAVFRRGFASHHRAGILRAHPFERFQSVAHQFGDGGILFCDGFLQSDGIDVHGDLLDSWVCTERDGGHHQADTQIVCRAYRRPVRFFEFDPIVCGPAVFAFRHHGGTGGGECQRHVAVRKIRAEFNVKTVWQSHTAQEQRKGLPVYPFGAGTIGNGRRRCGVGEVVGGLLCRLPRDAHDVA